MPTTPAPSLSARERFAAAARRQQAQPAPASAKKAASGAAAPPREEATRRKSKPQRKKTPPPTLPKDFISVREFCAAHGVGETGVFRAIARGQLPSLKVGHCRLISLADYERYKAEGLAHRQSAVARAQAARKTAAAKRRAARCATEIPTP